MQQWCPGRPSLALEAVQLIIDGIGMVHAPDDKRKECRLPFKIFCKLVTLKLIQATVTEGQPKQSVQCAVGAAMTAIFCEAEQARAANNLQGSIELHGSIDAAWKGTAARGCGLAMDHVGIQLVASAAARVRSHLLQPMVKIPRRI